MMAQVCKLGSLLGPKCIMANPKTGTVTFEIEKAVQEIKAGKVKYRADKAGNVHVAIGKSSFDNEKLVDKFAASTETIEKVKRQSAKDTYAKNVSSATTMNPGVKVND